MSEEDAKSVSLKALLEELAESQAPIRGALVNRLSEPTSTDLAILKEQWPLIPTEKRQTLIVRLFETSESDFDFDFSDVALFALDEKDDLVREYAVKALWLNEEPETMRRLIHLIEHDNAPLVRSAAAEGLGQFILNGELGEIEQALSQEAEETLLAVLRANNEPVNVQRRALESLAYSSRDEVVTLIKQAYLSNNPDMKASAIFAMGRSADPRWHEDVLLALDSSEESLRYEAAKAAGELVIRSSVSRLIDLILDEDREIRNAAIWSLGEIGGSTAENALMRLAENAEDEDLIEALEDAIANAQLGPGDFPELSLGELDSSLDDFEE